MFFPIIVINCYLIICFFLSKIHVILEPLLFNRFRKAWSRAHNTRLWIIARPCAYIYKRYETRIRIQMESSSTWSVRLSDARRDAKQAGAELRIRRGYPISELWEFIATPSPRAYCRGAAASSGLPSGLNYCQDPPKPSKLLVPATDQHLEHFKDANVSNRRRAPSGIHTISSNLRDYLYDYQTFFFRETIFVSILSKQKYKPNILFSLW